MADHAKLPFASDYEHGAHPAILDLLVATNMEPSPGYGLDAHSERARELVRQACHAPEAEVHFLVGGTQTNALVIDTLLKPWQGVLSADTGHIATHEAGAIEACGHKVITLASHEGKLDAAELRAYLADWHADENRDHMVMPGLIYLSHPTEYGTLYSLAELCDLRAVCDAYGLGLYVDGARLAYALGAPGSDVTLADLARLTDAFYLGGTKCGALFGEAVVFSHADSCPHFFSLVKRRGALLAKGRLLGLQFEALMDHDLYQAIGRDACERAAHLARTLEEAGCELVLPQQTNQVFVALDPAQEARLAEQVEMSFWERLADGRSVFRLATSWATADRDLAAFDALVRG